MWMIWTCPKCGGYCEEIAIEQHKEYCDGFTTQQEAMQKGRLQERDTGSDSPE